MGSAEILGRTGRVGPCKCQTPSEHISVPLAIGSLLLSQADLKDNPRLGQEQPTSVEAAHRFNMNLVLPLVPLTLKLHFCGNTMFV